MQLVVSKFGGSSMADLAAMTRSANICLEQKSSIVLVSATYGTTDLLVSLCKNAAQGDWNLCEQDLFKITQKHHIIAKELQASEAILKELNDLLENLETLIKGVHLLSECSVVAKDKILSLGERMSSLLFSEVIKKVNSQKEVHYFDIREVMATDSHHGKAEPKLTKIKKLAQKNFQFSDNTIYVTQGFIGKSEEGATTTLGRGGSDYSASLIAEAIDADLLQIWTDVAGIATTDPRICPKARPINEITYKEASEMAVYGAKILHPTTLVPAIRGKISVFVGSSYEKDEPGTWIQEKSENLPAIRAITKRDNQALLIIRTPEMLNAYGFMEKIFEVFNEHRISVDCVTTSEISVAITTDYANTLNESFMQALNPLGEIIVEVDYSLISLIGNNIHQTSGLGQQIFQALGDINVRMICLGASDHNFCFIVENAKSDTAIKRLHKHFIEEGEK